MAANPVLDILASPDDFRAARNGYCYIPARLICADHEPADLAWTCLRLKMDIPGDWDKQQVRSQHSSIRLDRFHRELLNSDDETRLLHGLLSVVFWGFASGADGRVNAQRALSKSRAILLGRDRAPAQQADHIVQHLRRCQKLISDTQIKESLMEAQKIKFLGMSFASKVITFMNPGIAAVYDDVISQRLHSFSDPRMSRLCVSTRLATSSAQRDRQGTVYEAWCRWCSEIASQLNGDGRTWQDWDGSENEWRAVDVERAFFALGRDAVARGIGSAGS